LNQPVPAISSTIPAVSSGATSSACEKCGRWELALQLFSELSAAQLEAPRCFRNEMDSFTTKNGDFTRKKREKPGDFTDFTMFEVTWS